MRALVAAAVVAWLGLALGWKYHLLDQRGVAVITGAILALALIIIVVRDVVRTRSASTKRRRAAARRERNRQAGFREALSEPPCQQ